MNVVESIWPLKFPVSRSLFLILAAAGPVLTWVWLCHDRPAKLGFYSDDWMLLLPSAPASAQAFRDIMSAVATRPVSAPYIWLAQTIVDWSAYQSQLLNCLMLALSAVSVAGLSGALVSLSGASRRSTIVCASFAATAFVVFPSNVGTFAWGSGVITAVPAVPLFCLGAALLVHSTTLMRLLCAMLLLAGSHLSYEAFYFQEITVITIGALLGYKNLKSRMLQLLIAAVVVNAACIAFNRLETGGVQKTFSLDWWSTFTTGYWHIFDLLKRVTRENWNGVRYAGIVSAALSFSAVCAVTGIFRAFLLAGALFCGIAAGGVLFSLAGYGVAMEGVMSRSSILIAFYFSIGAGVSAGAAWQRIVDGRSIWIISLVALSIVLGNFALASRYRAAEWANAWAYELARLTRIPHQLYGPRQQGQIFVALERHGSSPIAVATAPWEIHGAVAWAISSQSPQVARQMMKEYWSGGASRDMWFATPKDWFNRWNGSQFEQGVCNQGLALYKSNGTELFLWETTTSNLQKVEPPWQAGC